MKALFQLLMLAALIAGVMAAVLGLGRYYAPLTVAHWRAQLDAVPDQSAEPLLRRVGSGGDVVIPILVEGLASPRQRVAEAARQALLEQIDRWKTLSTAGSSPKLALLARELADRQSELGPAGRHDAAALAVVILHGPLDPGTVDTVEVISCCEKVLRAAQADSPASVAAAVAKRMERDALSAASQSIADSAAARWQDTTSPDRPRSEDLTPRLLPPPAGQAAADASPQPLAKTGAAGKDSDPAKAQQPEAPVNPTKGLAGGDGVRQVSAVEKLPAAAPADQLKTADSFDLLQQSCSPIQQTALAARAELTRRGFSEVHFDLARRLYSADPAVRKELARALPELRSVDAAPWLIQLSRDSNPEVRLTAITLMATSGDPLLLEQVERIAGDDSDPRIREQVSRIDQQRNDASQRGAAMASRPQPRN
ncbi:MAG: HEAT repeat domain-containing protein [Thermoguttaceae bacterium]